MRQFKNLKMSKSRTCGTVLLFIIHCSFFITSAQPPGQWTFMKGDTITNQPGVFGIKGVPDSLNHPPALYEACEWIDLQGNFWLYGGLRTQVYADLWKFDPITNNWTWMNGNGLTAVAPVFGTKGVASSTNRPGSRGYGVCSWRDTSNSLWLYGGTTTLGTMNDLWRYDIATDMWTWISGDNFANSGGNYGTKGIPSVNNAPRFRNECTAAWLDSANNLWLFGGGNYLNDLWRYNISTTEWTWMSGSNLINSPSVYGTKGVSAPANIPGARWIYSHWKDLSGNFWLFGGGRYSSMNNDLWKYDLSINEWTWMSGTNVLNDPGVYGTLCLPDSSIGPSSAIENRSSWTDACGNFWLLGGINHTNSNQLNDLWQYNPTTDKWTWVNGDSTVNPAGSFGTMGVSSPSNQPGNRCGSLAWKRDNGQLWLFGGFQNNSGLKPLSDLWRYVPDPACGGCVQALLPAANFISSDTTFCNEAGECINFFDQSTGNPTSWQWLFPGGSPDTSSQQNPINICYYTPGTYSATLIVTNSAGTDTLNVYPMITYLPGPPPPIVTVLNGDTLVSSYGNAYQWFFNGNPIAGATDSFYLPVQGGTYSVRITDTLGCTSISSGVLITALFSNKNLIQSIHIYPNPVGDELIIQTSEIADKDVSVEIYNVFGEKVFAQNCELKAKSYGLKIDVSSLAKAVYFIHLTCKDIVGNNGEKWMRKFVKE